MEMKNNKILVILGPTASGKTKLAVELAVKLNGEIVSGDSRQVYKGMDIGTGKDLKEFSISKKIKIPYHLIDVVSPKARFDLAQYQDMAFKAIDDVLQRGKLPILAGGSGLYLQAVVDNYKLADVKKDWAKRRSLEKSTADELFNKLKKLSPKMAAKLNQSDKNNKRRLIRYLEILVQDENFRNRRGPKKYETLIIGLRFGEHILRQRIFKRLLERLKEQNMTGEVENLHKQGLSWKKLESFGLEYKFIALYLQGRMEYDELIEKLNIAIYQFAKRQLTWFKRWEKQGAEIYWVGGIKEIEKLVRDFLK